MYTHVCIIIKYICTYTHIQGVLLYGPPGTGKTLLARAVAHHTECCFIRVSGSELVQKYIGEGSRMVRREGGKEGYSKEQCEDGREVVLDSCPYP